MVELVGVQWFSVCGFLRSWNTCLINCVRLRISTETGLLNYTTAHSDSGNDDTIYRIAKLKSAESP